MTILLVLLGLSQLTNRRLLMAPASWFPFTTSSDATIQTLIVWSAYACLLWSAPQILQAREVQRRFVWTLFCLGAFIAVIGIIQNGQGDQAYYGLRLIRQGKAFGPYANRDHAASMLVMTMMIGGGLLLAHWQHFKERFRARALPDWLATQSIIIFFLGIIIFAIVGLFSRGALNSMIVSLGIIPFLATHFIKDSRTRLGAKTIFGALLGSYLIFLYSHPILIGGIIQNPDMSTAIRLSIYRSGFKLFRDFPVWGIGLGTLQFSFPFYQEHFVSHFVDHIHNDWLELLLQTGLIGMAITAAGFCLFFFQLIRAWYSFDSYAMRCLAGGALAGMMAFLFHEMVDFSFQIPANAVIFLSLAAFLNALTASLPVET